MPRMMFKDLAEVAQEIEVKAAAEDKWKEAARKASDKDRAENRAAAFREVVALLKNSTIG